MRSLAYALPALPGIDSPKTYAAWPVWHDSTPADVKFHPAAEKEGRPHLITRPASSSGGHGRPADRTGRSGATAWPCCTR